MELKRELCQSDRNEILRQLQILEADTFKDANGYRLYVASAFVRIKEIVSQPRHPQGTEGSFTGISTEELDFLARQAEVFANKYFRENEPEKHDALVERIKAIDAEIERRILALPTPQK